MRRALLVLSAVVLAGCSSAEARKGAPTAAEVPGNTNDNQTNTQTAQPTNLKGDAAHNRPPESNDPAVPAETERAVLLPDSLEVAAAPVFPERPRVAVAFVRGGKLVRRSDALRRLAHDFERDARVEALERFADDAPSQLSLAGLCERAEKQGALLLLVDARATDDSDKTTYVFTTKAPSRALAFTRPKTTEPAGNELVARLVRTSRVGP